MWSSSSRRRGRSGSAGISTLKKSSDMMNIEDEIKVRESYNGDKSMSLYTRDENDEKTIVYFVQFNMKRTKTQLYYANLHVTQLTLIILLYTLEIHTHTHTYRNLMQKWKQLRRPQRRRSKNVRKL